MNRHLSDISNRVLLVEGDDDLHVVSHIRYRSDTTLEFQIIDRGGVAQLLDSIWLEVREPGREALGIIVDGDIDIVARWDAVRNRLRDEGFDVPARPDRDGTIILETEDLPRVGVWLMPDNESAGELEDFVARMIPGDDSVWPLSEDYIEGIPLADRKFAENKTQRAKVHAWLAAREDPRRMGQAVRARDLDVDGELCEKFVAWLRKLFG